MRKRYHYIIVLCCFLSLFVNIGLPSTSFAVYQPYVVALVGDAGGSAILAVRILVSLLVLVVADRYYDLLDARRGLALAMLCTAVGFGVYSVARSVAAFLVGAVLCGVAYGFGGMLATTILVNRWFGGGIGTAVGAASVGSGVAGTVMPVLAAHIIESASLQAAFRAAGLLALACAAVVFALLRNRPADMGLAPYAPAQKERRAGRERAKRGDAFPGAPSTLGAVDLSPVGRRVLFAAIMMVGAFCMAGVAYLSVLLGEAGFGVHFAALLVSVTGFALTVAKFVVGALFDRIGGPRASAVMFGILVAGLALLCFAAVPLGPAAPAGPAAACAGAACLGCGLSLGTVGVSVWSLQFSSSLTRQRSIKDAQLAFAAGGFAMNLLPGPLKLLAGGYAASYVLMLVCGICAAAIILGIYARLLGSSCS